MCAEYPAFLSSWGMVGMSSGKPFTEPCKLANVCPVLNEYLPVIRDDLAMYQLLRLLRKIID
jgi:hypothetical protein